MLLLLSKQVDILASVISREMYTCINGSWIPLEILVHLQGLKRNVSAINTLEWERISCYYRIEVLHESNFRLTLLKLSRYRPAFDTDFNLVGIMIIKGRERLYFTPFLHPCFHCNPTSSVCPPSFIPLILPPTQLNSTVYSQPNPVMMMIILKKYQAVITLVLSSGLKWILILD